ncbi:MAG: GGDEF domain-containing protein, partial [Treponema sp.]|nr:GGDEF domain-containing protein [Treponema sp.]
VIFGDMDGLKYINDNFGHDAGDRAIKAEAEILKNNFRASDIVGRMGGDEFVIIAAGLGEPRLSAIRENIDAACKAWNIVHNEGFELSISMGCASFTPDSKNLEDILREADSLLYEEKRQKKNSRR